MTLLSSGKVLLLTQWLPLIYEGEPLLDPLIQGELFQGWKYNKFGQKTFSTRLS